MSLSFWLVAATMLAVAVLETASQTLFKSAVHGRSMAKVTPRAMLALAGRLLLSLRVWLGMWLGLATLGLWTWAMAQADLNLVFGLSSLHYLLIALSSRLILKEPVGRWRLAGSALITAGIALIALSGA